MNIDPCNHGFVSKSQTLILTKNVTEFTVNDKIVNVWLKCFLKRKSLCLYNYRIYMLYMYINNMYNIGIIILPDHSGIWLNLRIKDYMNDLHQNFCLVWLLV